MANWNEASEGDKILLNALSLLYERNENIFHLLLNPDKPCLISSVEEIKENIQELTKNYSR